MYDISFKSLLDAARKCARGVKWKDSIASWVHPRNIAANCIRLLDAVRDGTYRIGGYVLFHVTEPKRRLIMSPRFRDRVLQRALCDAGLYRDLTRDAIADNCACQVGKGTLYAARRLKRHLHDYWRKNGCEGWALKLDIRHFFASIPHDRLKAMVERKVSDPLARRLVCDVIDSFDDPGIGLGSQLSQLLAIAYLSPLDHWIKERSGARYYIRYSDDIVIIDSSRDFLKELRARIAERLGAMGLVLNPKSHMRRLSEGVPFLKSMYRLGRDGSVLRIVGLSSYRRVSRRLRALAAMGGRSVEDLSRCFASWMGHVMWADSHGITRRMRWVLSSATGIANGRRTSL